MQFRNFIAITMVLLFLVATAVHAADEPARTGPNRVTIDQNLVLEINGKKTFVIGFTLPPPPDAKAFNGKHAYEEIHDGGANFFRTGPIGQDTDWKTWADSEQKYENAAAKYGMLCAPWLKEFSGVKAGDTAKEEELKKIINRFKDNPGLGVWKGDDEPEWGKKPVPPMVNAAKIIHQTDPNHPIWIVQAPRGTVETMKAYDATYDITGVDIYPISYPPGTHVPKHPNREISMVGDYALTMMQVAGGKKPVWITLQIAFSGTTPSPSHPNAVIRFPTFAQERYMAYQSIITGARGLIFFGPGLQPTLNDGDKKLGWNWTFWQRVMRPLLEEIGEKSPLQPALVAANSKLPIKVEGAPAGIGKELEFLVRETDSDLYILAAKRQGETLQVKFAGLPGGIGSGQVMYEEPRTVEAKDGTFSDWFAPFDVHIYRFHRQ